LSALDGVTGAVAAHAAIPGARVVRITDPVAARPRAVDATGGSRLRGLADPIAAGRRGGAVRRTCPRGFARAAISVATARTTIERAGEQRFYGITHLVAAVAVCGATERRLGWRSADRVPTFGGQDRVLPERGTPTGTHEDAHPQ
jgi:hypothetical protein